MNGIIVIDKPPRFTSFDVVAVMRGLFGTKKVGHTGTLDPMATGVLPILIGSATKAQDLTPDSGKEYVAGFRLGVVTDTEDSTGTVKETFPVTADEKALEAINYRICELGDKLGLPVVATCDVHFLDEKDEIYRRVLMGGQGYADADLQPPVFFRTTEEMLNEFTYLGEKKAREVVIDNTRKIADAMDSFKPIPDELYSPEIPY